MLAKPNFIKCLVILVVLLCGGASGTKHKRKISGNVWNKVLQGYEAKGVKNETGRGLFFRGGLLSFSKVLNFFPVGGERECQPSGYNVAKAGICLNTYDCRQRDGKAAGDCAHGLGVCCVFEVSCGGVVQNNLTYFMSPGFPELWNGDEDCNITIEKTYAGIMQLKIDFVHFTIGQPNRTTGECTEDAMVIGDGETKFTMCGQNHGQHIYYTLSSSSEAREEGDLPSSKTTSLSMRMRGGDMPRLWLLRLAQMPLAQSAPHGCLQYFTADNGTIKTFNYATNGRHLAGQEYKACIRRNKNRCSVRYTPCDQRSFRIGPGEGTPEVIDPADPDQTQGPGGAGGPGTGFYGPDGSFVSYIATTTEATATPIATDIATTTTTVTAAATTTTEAVIMNQIPAATINGSDEMMPVQDTQTQEDEMEGSGQDPQIEAPSREEPGMFYRIWSYIESWIWGQSSARSRSLRWSPYTQHYSEDDNFRYFGYGNFGVGMSGFGRQRCQDRVTIPCENEYFISSDYYNVGVCDPHHCGNTFCPGQNFQNCWVETSITPFTVSMNFGPPTIKRSPDENIGMCLRYSQLPCDS